MWSARVALPGFAGLALALAGAPAPAAAAEAPAAPALPSGGVQAPSAPRAGGIQYGVATHAAGLSHPALSALSVPASALAGPPPRITLRLDEPGVATVHLGVTVTELATRTRVIAANMGWVRTARTITVVWPRGSRLSAGTYLVSITSRDHHNGKLLRAARISGVSTLTVTAPVVLTAISPAAAGVPSPAQSAAEGAVFPVAGPHSFGNAENRFGAPRADHVHQGQDILAAEGTPIRAPFAGSIITASFQAGGAGYYVAEHTGVGFDFMFAHCKAGSLAVTTGQAVSQGQTVCLAGQTGDATTPHLHFEMWVGGWHVEGGQPIDPLPYLQAWEQAAS